MIWLSIIVPAYNVEKYIKECLDSLVNQNIEKTEYEIICIDDGSLDETPRILNSYEKKHSNVRVIHKENEGVSVARNVGIKEARGEYVWFVDGDDFVADNSLKSISDFQRQHATDIIFVQPKAFIDGYDTSILRNFRGGYKDETAQKYSDWLWTRLIKRSIIIESGVRFNPKISLAEDHMFCTMLGPYVKTVASYKEIAYFYRIRENSASTAATEGKVDKLICSCKEFLDAGNQGIINKTVAMKIVYDQMIPVMNYMAKLPRKEANSRIKELERMHLFPLKHRADVDKQYDKGTDLDNRVLLTLKENSYTKRGYYLLRIWRYWLRIKRRFRASTR